MKEKRQTLLTVVKALNALHVFTQRQWIGVRELSRELDINNATAQQILTTLGRFGFVEQDPTTRKYQLGLGIVQLAGAKLVQTDLVGIAQPLLNELMLASGETVNLAVPYQGQALYLAKVESHQLVRAASRIGGTAPLYCSAHGKALLAFAPEPQLEDILDSPLEQLTAETVTDPNLLRAELDYIRRSGVARDLSGYISDLNALASPVRDHSGTVVASIGIVAPSNRLPARNMPAAEKLVLNTAAAISARLGWTGAAR